MATGRSKQGLIGRLLFLWSKKLAFKEITFARSQFPHVEHSPAMLIPYDAAGMQSLNVI